MKLKLVIQRKTHDFIRNKKYDVIFVKLKKTKFNM